MKKIYSYILLIAILFFQNKISAQSANKTLSNLTSPTTVNVNLLPKNNDVQNLGSTTKAWHALYLKGSIFLDGQKFISNPGNGNTLLGSNAGKSVTTINNTVVGANALFKNKTGFSNMAIGNSTLYNNDSGYNNVAIGDSALFSGKGLMNTANTAIGNKSLFFNKGVANTATGIFSLYNNITGNQNCAYGLYSLQGNVSGGYNTAVGVNALYNNISGVDNTGVGYYSSTGANGNFNSAFGADAAVNDNTFNSSAIGTAAYAATSNRISIGGSTIVSIGGTVDWSSTSDSRVKKNIKQNVPGLAFINKLQAVTYNLNLDAVDNIIQRPILKDENGNIIRTSQKLNDARKAQEQIIYTGFIAQEVETAAKSLHYDFSGVDAAKNEHDLYGLRYGSFVVPLVKAVQELSKMNDAKDASIDSLKNDNVVMKSEIQNLKSGMEEIKNMIVTNQSIDNNQQSIKISSASLLQNVPNPFNHTTTINYVLPSGIGGTSARIIVTDNAGKTIKEISINGTGKGSVQIDASTLSSGTYQYSLIVDGRTLASKQMMLTK